MDASQRAREAERRCRTKALCSIGSKLRQMYERELAQPVPDRLRQLVERLSEGTRPG